MRKFFIIISFFISLFSFADCSYKKEMVNQHLHDVLKTQNQLVPKLVRYIVLTGIKKEEFDVAKNSIKVAVLANSTVDREIFVYIDERQEAFEEINKLISHLKTNIHNILTYNDENNLIKDILEKKGSIDKLEYRRILLLTSSKNMRKYYAKLINVLDDNKENLIIDNFAYLYKTTRQEYEHPTQQEIEEVYNQINCK